MEAIEVVDGDGDGGADDTSGVETTDELREELLEN